MGLRIVYALNVTRSSKNYEEFVSYKSVFSLWSFRFVFFFFFYANVTVLGCIPLESPDQDF